MRASLEKPNPKRRGLCNEFYFDVLDTEAKPYWLGFLAADGSVDEKTSAVILGISSKDRDHLDQYRDALIQRRAG